MPVASAPTRARAHTRALTLVRARETDIDYPHRPTQVFYAHFVLTRAHP